MTDTVGVRELRQNLSKYLDRVKAGETLIVTERGREVARLVRSGPDVSPYYRRLAVEFGATIPTRRLEDVIDEMDRSGPRRSREEIEAIIDDMRADRF